MVNPKAYRNMVLSAMPRVFGLLDRNPASPTYGCFDRSYWLHRKTDYPVSTAQLLTSTLAHLYKNDFEANKYYRSAKVFEYIQASLHFTLSIQHSDGSFDEWYPNERGWAGPTGYVAHSICETLSILRSELDAELISASKKHLLLAAEHLNVRDEKDILANHYAIALLPLFQIAKLTGEKRVEEYYQSWKLKFLSLQTEEGWFLEYDGCDLGYALGTLDFLASLHRISGEQEYLEAAKRSLKFLSHFAFPDGEWAGEFGSRHTVHSYPFALEYWATLTNEGRALLAHQREAFQNRVAVLPIDQEDHYLSYRIRDYLKAADVFYEKPISEVLPINEKTFLGASFPQAKFEIISGDNYLAWIAAGRGGAFRVYEKESKRLIQKNSGLLLKNTKGQVFSSLWQGSSYRLKGRVLEIQGNLEPVFLKKFQLHSFLAFRIVCWLASSRRLAYWLKVFIRSVLITHKKSSPYRWIRILDFQPKQIHGKDKMSGSKPMRGSKIWWGAGFFTRYVPQGCYFVPSDLDQALKHQTLQKDDWEESYLISAMNLGRSTHSSDSTHSTTTTNSTSTNQSIGSRDS